MNSNPMASGRLCQSCSLTLETPDLLGTDARGERIAEYCVYCYHDGRFTEPGVSREDMIERLATLLMREEHLTHLQARDAAESLVPSLKRWSVPPCALA
jgi:hypothetical protein